MKQKYILALAALFLLVCSGCFVFGTNKDYHPFEAELLDSVEPGQTTAKDISSVFGAPTKIVKMSNGNAFIYQRSVAKATLIWLVLISFGNYDNQVDQVVFFFDNQDVLTHFGASMNADKAGYGLPF
jgi:outer membrane protein assembly factor BamE (lipoprotein component of BamABCDE complex)